MGAKRTKRGAPFKPPWNVTEGFRGALGRKKVNTSSEKNGLQGGNELEENIIKVRVRIKKRKNMSKTWITYSVDRM